MPEYLKRPIKTQSGWDILCPQCDNIKYSDNKIGIIFLWEKEIKTDARLTLLRALNKFDKRAA